MKSLNLQSLVEFYYEDSEENILLNDKYCGNEIKITDIEALKHFIMMLRTQDPKIKTSFFNDFFIGYLIDRIGKEFDLLRFSNDAILNIELKKERTDKIEKQLIRNKYYLKFLNKEMFLFTYVAKENTLYKLDDEDKLVLCESQEVIDILRKQDDQNTSLKNKYYIQVDSPDNLFKPSNYLISPFNKTKDFIEGKYFLTQEQEQIENEISNSIKQGKKYFLITGKAGTGKTLLTYHLAKKFTEMGDKVGLIHGGNLNEGHRILRDQFNWHIKPIKDYQKLFDKEVPKFIIIDEFQRLNRKSQYKELKNNISNNETILIISGDREQILGKGEGLFFNDIPDIEQYELKETIRTNKKLANFIRVLLDLNDKNKIFNENEKKMELFNNNINITYFKNFQTAKEYILSKNSYKYICYTPNTEKYSPSCKFKKYKLDEAATSHQVIGQEFENVITILDEHFCYDKNQQLKADLAERNPYLPLKMFVQT